MQTLLVWNGLEVCFSFLLFPFLFLGGNMTFINYGGEKYNSTDWVGYDGTKSNESIQRSKVPFRTLHQS